MINKKNLLGKKPFELGDKDAIHVAIVSVRAGGPIRPGQRCSMNDDREAVVDRKGPGVADPFLKTPLHRGEWFWLLLDLGEVPNVRHTWEHPTVDFTPPQSEPTKNKWLQDSADQLGVTYEQLMDACNRVVVSGEPVAYPGTKPKEEVEQQWRMNKYDVWSEWSDETGHEFENEGTACCPEPVYPYCSLFGF